MTRKEDRDGEEKWDKGGLKAAGGGATSRLVKAFQLGNTKEIKPFG